jgi:glycosyltransferase involved in cell wall biosynthesis
VTALADRSPRSIGDPARTGAGLSLVIHCFNEAERLPRTLAAYLAELPRQPDAVEILVVDDGSTDQTFAVARAIAAQDGRVRVIRSQPNRGKGFGVRTGVLQANGALIVFTDADGSYGPGEVARVTAALADAPVAIGSRPAGWATGSPARPGGHRGPGPGRGARWQQGPASGRRSGHAPRRASHTTVGGGRRLRSSGLPGGGPLARWCRHWSGRTTRAEQSLGR